MYFDGSYTQYGSGAGIFFITSQGHTILKSYRQRFPCTNNIVEYEALTIGLKMSIEWNVKELHVYGDSQLVINQINDEYQTKDDKLMPYKQLVEEFKGHFTEITFTQIPRNENKAVDAMATIASLLQNKENQQCYEFLVEDILTPTIQSQHTYRIFHISGTSGSLYSQTYQYLKDHILPLELSHNQ